MSVEPAPDFKSTDSRPKQRLLAPCLIGLVLAGAVLVWNLTRENPHRRADRLAAQEKEQFVQEHLPKAQRFPDRLSVLEHSLKQVDPKLKGLYCEFGVGDGTSINFIASKTPETIHGFDSFEGLPEKWRDGFDKGTFAQDGLPKVPTHVKLHKGWFNESVPGWAQQHPGPLAFIHMDADLYSSTKTVFDLLGDRIVPGTIIQFDEFFNYPGWREHEYKAFMELVEARGLQFEYLGFASQQVAVRITAVGKTSAAQLPQRTEAKP